MANNILKMQCRRRWDPILRMILILLSFPRSFWSHVKSTSNSTKIPQTIHYKGKFRNNIADQCELFNLYFENTFSEKATIISMWISPMIHQWHSALAILKLDIFLKILTLINLLVQLVYMVKYLKIVL